MESHGIRFLTSGRWYQRGHLYSLKLGSPSYKVDKMIIFTRGSRRPLVGWVTTLHQQKLDETLVDVLLIFHLWSRNSTGSFLALQDSYRRDTCLMSKIKVSKLVLPGQCLGYCMCCRSCRHRQSETSGSGGAQFGLQMQVGRGSAFCNPTSIAAFRSVRI